MTNEIWTTREACERSVKHFTDSDQETSKALEERKELEKIEWFKNYLKERGSWRCVKVAVVDPDILGYGGGLWRDKKFDDSGGYDGNDEKSRAVWRKFSKGDVGYVVACDSDEWILENWGLLRLIE